MGRQAALLGLVLVVRSLRRNWLADGARRPLEPLPATLRFFKRQGRQVDKPVSMYAVISRARLSPFPFAKPCVGVPASPEDAKLVVGGE